MGLSQSEVKKVGEEAEVEEEGNCLPAEAAESYEESDEEGSSVKVQYSLDAGAEEATKGDAVSF